MSFTQPVQFPKAVKALDRDWDRMLTFFDFPTKHWRHLRTTNVVESPFASVRLRTNAAKRYKKIVAASALIWRTLMVAEKRFRRLNAPLLLEEIISAQRTQPHGCARTPGERFETENRQRGEGGGTSVCEYGRNDKTPKGCPTESCVNGRPPKLADGNMAPQLILSSEPLSVRQS